ncbi:Ro-like RNA binding protein [Rhodococcus phage Shagrat]|nr:Ro-like RNA binding protein [Rhodococcus phage Shagrat]
METVEADEKRNFKVTVGFKGGTTITFRCNAFSIRPGAEWRVTDAIPQILHMNLDEIAWVTSLDLTDHKEH